jgi:NAD(P)H dehydrogenase (quinone)
MGNPTHVLVVFYSRCGTTEKLALAAAVGAVQARANIRLRRLTDVTEVAQCRDEIARMRKEYVAPAEGDVLWADAIIFLLPPELDASSAECAVYLDLLRRLNKTGGQSPARFENASQATSHGRTVATALRS